MNYKRIYIASDHAGWTLKESFITRLPLPWKDLGPYRELRVDYPDYAHKLVHILKEDPLFIHEEVCGVLICGSGQGMAMSANHHQAIRAALCWDSASTQLSRQHNNANILCLGARLITTQQAMNLLSLFLNTPFEGERHLQRVNKIS